MLVHNLLSLFLTFLHFFPLAIAPEFLVYTFIWSLTIRRKGCVSYFVRPGSRYFAHTDLELLGT